MIQYTELLWEMAAKRRGRKMRWHVVIVLEVAKALCRLLLLRLTNSRPLLTPPLPERDVDPALDEMCDSSSPGSMSGAETPPAEPVAWKMPRTGLELPSLPDSGRISQYLLSRVLTAEDVKPPAQLLHRIRGTGYLAEVLYIIRPVVYAVAMKKFANDRKSWTPWLLGFSIEYAARQLSKRELEMSVPGGLKGLSQLEKDELTRRAWAMGWWSVRGAFYQNITGYVVEFESGLCSFANGFIGRSLRASRAGLTTSRCWACWAAFSTTTSICGTTTTFHLRLSRFISSGCFLTPFFGLCWGLPCIQHRHVIPSLAMV